MKTLKPAAIVFAALTLMLTIGACAHHDDAAVTQTTTRTQTHSHAPGTPPHND